jgi:hypothetical protein
MRAAGRNRECPFPHRNFSIQVDALKNNRPGWGSVRFIAAVKNFF